MFKLNTSVRIVIVDLYFIIVDYQMLINCVYSYLSKWTVSVVYSLARYSMLRNYLHALEYWQSYYLMVTGIEFSYKLWTWVLLGAKPNVKGPCLGQCNIPRCWGLNEPKHTKHSAGLLHFWGLVRDFVWILLCQFLVRCLNLWIVNHSMSVSFRIYIFQNQFESC